jgi:hypothetical protein
MRVARGFVRPCGWTMPADAGWTMAWPGILDGLVPPCRLASLAPLARDLDRLLALPLASGLTA